MRNIGRAWLVFLGIAALGAGCSSVKPRKYIGDGGTGICPDSCKSCDDSGVCHDCTPDKNSCDTSGNVVACNSDGTIGDIVKTCNAGYRCAGGDCFSACDAAASSHSYIGCDYWPVTLLNSELNPYFDFAVTVANPVDPGDGTAGSPADVTITRDGQMVKQITVAPGDVATITLPWVKEVSQPPSCPTPDCSLNPEKSVISRGGAYHLVSTMPVTVYQFNPLQFEKSASSTCNDGDGSGKCHSYTNAASILLPTTALKNEYIAIGRQTLSLGDPFSGSAITIPGYLAVVATEDGTKVTVDSTMFTEAGTGVAALSPGGTQDYMLDAGDVLELVSKRATTPCANKSSDSQGNYCDLGPQYDPTGSHILADKPVAVFGGHSCTFTPYNKWACDHLEEQMTPLETWGQKIIVAQTKPATANEPNVWRIISGSDGNTITFDPPGVHASVTLDSGKWIEFVASGGFQATGTGRTAIGQYMVGENFFTNASIMIGDPSLGLGVPVEQYRTNYDFLAPSSYTQNVLTVIAPMNASVELDGQPVMGAMTSIGQTGYGYQYITLQPGGHHVTSGQPFGITVSGLGAYTSYLFVGGQNLNDIVLQ